MTTKIPPCPVCGVVPEQNGKGPYLKVSDECVTHITGKAHHRLGTKPNLYHKSHWRDACKYMLANTLIAHGIETVAQVDALAKIAVIFVGLYEAGKTGAYMSDSVIALCKQIKEGKSE